MLKKPAGGILPVFLLVVSPPAIHCISPATVAGDESAKNNFEHQEIKFV
jgi:hypothetical protein